MNTLYNNSKILLSSLYSILTYTTMVESIDSFTNEHLQASYHQDSTKMISNLIQIITIIAPVYFFLNSLKASYHNGQKGYNMLATTIVGWLSSNSLLDQNNHNATIAVIIFTSIPLAFYVGSKFPSKKSTRTIGTQTSTCN